MKYIVILGDGMGDYPLPALGGKTPLEAADCPNMDYLAAHGELGLAQTLFPGMPRGSDVANMCVLGYDPKKYYSGRSPVEAVGLGLTIAPDETVFRCNLVTLSIGDMPFERRKMIDHSSDKISTEEAAELVAALNREVCPDGLKIYPGVSYRHIAMWKNVTPAHILTPPHDILEREIAAYLPGDNPEILEFMQKSFEVLSNHPVNLQRIKEGKRPANSVWFWGEGKAASFDPFYDKFKMCGSVITAVPLIMGLGIGMGLRIIEVPGATGDINTNFEGKAAAAIKALKDGDDFVFLHIEAPDECGHDGDAHEKTRSIELIDRLVVGPVLKALLEFGEPFKILLTPDHATPVPARTHTLEPIPYVLYKSGDSRESNAKYSEAEAAKTGVFVEKGYDLMDRMCKF